MCIAINEGDQYMKKIILSSSEKKILRMVIVFVLIQSVIAFAFVHMLSSSQQVNVNQTKQIDIIVEDKDYYRVPREYWLFVVSNSTEYLFMGRSSNKEYSVSELYESISKGDKLSLRYSETNTIWGKVNLVVDARSETETYRNIDEYNHAKKGVPAFVIIIFFIIELIFVGIVYMYFKFSSNTIKSFYKKAKNHLLNP